MKWYIRNVVEALGIATIIIIIWQGLELLIYKEIVPNHVDTIIALIMTFVVHAIYVKNIRSYDIKRCDIADDLNRSLEEIKQDMNSYKKMFEDERVSRETQDFYLNRYSYAESLYHKIETILKNNKEI